MSIQREWTCGLFKIDQSGARCGLLPEFALHHEFITAQNSLRNLGLRWLVRHLERPLARRIAARRRWHSRIAETLLKDTSPALAICSRCVCYLFLSDL